MPNDMLLPLYYSTNFKAFAEEILGLTIKGFHEKWIEHFENNKKFMLLAPRRHGKTTLLSAYIIWEIIRNPDIRILLVSTNQNMASDIMSTVRHAFDKNKKLKDVFGDFSNSRGNGTWSTNAINVKKRTKKSLMHREKTLLACGVGGRFLGSHFDLIILDDIVDEKNCSTDGQRQKLRDWYSKVLLPTLERNSKMLCVGTKWHQNDIYSTFMRSKSWDSKRYRAIIKYPNETEDGKAVMLWDDEEDLENGLGFTYGDALEYIDENGKLAFEMQYQNEIFQTSDSPIREKWVTEAIDSFENIKSMPQLTRYMGVDLASEGGKDEFSITVIGVDNSKNIYVLKNVHGHYSMGKQLDLILSLAEKYNPVMKVGIESNATQKIITDEWKSKTKLPIFQIKSSWVNDKWSRCQNLSVRFETGRIYFNPECVKLKDELLSFPRGETDDCFDSLAFAVQAYEEGRKKTDWGEVSKYMKSKKSRFRKF